MPADPAAPRSDTVFAVVRKGYDQGQVERHLRRLEAELRIMVHDRDAAVDQSDQLTRELDEARARSERLRAQVRSLVSPPQSIHGMSERMRTMLRMAEDEVAEMRSAARAEADRRIAAADQQAAQILATARAQGDEIRAEATRQAERSAEEQARLAAQAEAARGLVDEDFRIAMDQRRSEALRALTAERQQARHEMEQQRRRAAAEAHETVATAQEQATSILADAEHTLVGMIELRNRLAVQLDHARGALESTLAGLGALPGEPGEPPASIRAARRPAVEGHTTVAEFVEASSQAAARAAVQALAAAKPAGRRTAVGESHDGSTPVRPRPTGQAANAEPVVPTVPIQATAEPRGWSETAAPPQRSESTGTAGAERTSPGGRHAAIEPAEAREQPGVPGDAQSAQLNATPSAEPEPGLPAPATRRGARRAKVEGDDQAGQDATDNPPSTASPRPHSHRARRSTAGAGRR